MDVTLLDLKSTDDLKFIGEGNEHIVLEVSNTTNVLRVRKFPIGVEVTQQELILQLNNDIYFVNNVARPLAGSLLIDEAQLARVDCSLMVSVMDQIKPLRDEKRFVKVINPFGLCILTKNVTVEFIDRLENFEFCPKILQLSRSNDSFTLYSGNFPYYNKCSMTDTCGKDADINISKVAGVSMGKDDRGFKKTELGEKELSTAFPKEDIYTSDGSERKICIELKTKQGVPELGPKGSLLCRFCLKQYVKIKSKMEQSHSAYCPRDLFSGDSERMKKALENLFETPQNNLKIFENGQRITELGNCKHLVGLVQLILKYGPLNSTSVTEVDLKDDNCPKTSTPSLLQRSTESIQRVPLLCQAPNYNIVQSDLDQANQISCIQGSKSLTGEIVGVKGSKFDLEVDKKEGRYTEKDGHDSVDARDVAQERQLSTSSFLGKILYLQSLGNIHEVQAAALYREIEKRENCSKKFNENLTNFQFLKVDCLKQNTSDSDSSNLIHKISGTNDNEVKYHGRLADLDSEDIYQLLQECFISMSAKDASLMLLINGPFKRSVTEPVIHKDVSSNTGDAPRKYVQSPFWIEYPSHSGSWYKCQVSLVDIALKEPLKVFDHEIKLGELEDILTRLTEQKKEPLCCVIKE